MHVFLDANILFSASKTNGAIRKLLGIAIQAGHELWADDFVLEEARRNLAMKYPDALSELASLKTKLNWAELGGPRVLEERWARLLPDKDRPVLEAAVQAGCEALLTSDRAHFGAFYGKSIQGVTVYSPTSFMKVIS